MEINLHTHLRAINPELAAKHETYLDSLRESLENQGVFESLELSSQRGHRLLQHSTAVSRAAGEIAEEYGLPEREQIDAIVGGLIHDAGKGIQTEKYSQHDSVDIESKLREAGLLSLGQAVRHNPALILDDFRFNRLSRAQIAVTAADAHIDSDGKYIGIDQRHNKILRNKDISPTLQAAYRTVITNYPRLFGATRAMPMQFRFIERFDGRYPVTNDYNTLGKLSSFHIAKELGSMGVKTAIYAYLNGEHDFEVEGVLFSGPEIISNLDAFIGPQEVVFASGWTSCFSRMHDGSLPATLVMRSLLRESLTDKRLDIIRNAGSACILLNQKSAQIVGSENCTIIPNGYNPDIFKHAPEKKIKKQIVFAGATVPEKGFDHFIEAAKSMPDYRFVVAGSAKMYGRPEYRWQIPNNMDLLGEVSQEELSELFNTSTASMFLTDPTRITEVFGKSGVESILCGCPLIYIKNGGLSDNIPEHPLTKGIDTNSAIAIVDATKAILDKCKDIKLRRDLASTAASMHLNWRQVAARYFARGLDAIIGKYDKLADYADRAAE